MLVLSFFVLPLVFGTPIPAPGSGCAAVHIITARASTEPPGEGIIGAVADDIVNSSAQPVSREAVDYPATLIPYASSEAAGVQAMNSDLAAQVKLCPSQKIVLLGYSQGAHVAGDVLASNASGIERGT
jgi:hypothetical protein